MKSELTKNIEKRLQRYKTAVAMTKGRIPTDNSFRWPFFPGFSPKDPKNVLYWNGCIAELEAVLEELGESTEGSQKTAKSRAKLPLTPASQGIHVDGHLGTWKVIRTSKDSDGKTTFTLEHERYGELTNHLLVDENAHIIRCFGRGEDELEDDYFDEY